jgi:predicted heme/steroid binding protein
LSESTRVFTEAELRRYDGRDGRPVYVAYDGFVYDVSDAPLWRTGMHQDLHYPGLDLTRSMRKAPHTPRVFERSYIRKVGVLKQG